MNSETYTPGHSENATNFMAKRTLASHGQFFTSCLKRGLDVLDMGCGPGTITLGISSLVAPGRVVGIDFGESQIVQARKNAEKQKRSNLAFHMASVYDLPFAEASFDRIFSHALMEHLARPIDALREAYRVLRPGEYI